MTTTAPRTRTHRIRRLVALGGLVAALGVATAACSDDDGTITVKGDDYAFTGLPAKLDAGEHEITFENVGEHEHEIVLMRLKDPKARVEDLLELPEEEAQKHVEVVGATFAEPGEKAKEAIKADLAEGRYAAVCFVSDDDQSPPHAMQGMVGYIDVA